MDNIKLLDLIHDYTSKDPETKFSDLVSYVKSTYPADGEIYISFEILEIYYKWHREALKIEENAPIFHQVLYLVDLYVHQKVDSVPKISSYGTYKEYVAFATYLENLAGTDGNIEYVHDAWLPMAEYVHEHLSEDPHLTVILYDALPEMVRQENGRAKFSALTTLLQTYASIQQQQLGGAG